MHQIKHWFHSIWTLSYWRYTFLSLDAAKTFFAVWGIIWLGIETFDYFKPFEFEFKKYSGFLLALAITVVIWTRRPITRICYKLPNRDTKIEIKVGDIFSVPGDTVISTNTTFDTDTASGLIATDSLQGKFTQLLYNNNVGHLDHDIETALAGNQYDVLTQAKGKAQKYKMGTVAKVQVKGRTFYLLAMADMNQHGTAQSSASSVRTALGALWEFIANQGNMGEIVIPLIGTGRGRISATREEMVKDIVKSFAQAIQKKRFATKLTIVILPKDYWEYDLNLFQLHDYLRHVHKYERAD